MSGKKLTQKQKLFCDEYLIDLNATQAAIRAGYSKKTAQKASDWINIKSQNKPSSKFQQGIYDLIQQRMAEKEKELIADQNEVMRYLTSVLRGQTKSSVIVIESSGDFTSSAREMEKAPDENQRLKAAELLGKAHMMFTEKVQQDVDMDLNITVDYGAGNE